MDEIFVPIAGEEGRYEISKIGNVRSFYFKGRLRKQPKILKPGLSHGYWSVVFCFQGKRKTAFIHKLLAEHFIPNPLRYKIINHLDGNRGNNELTNLEWCTYRQNSQHCVDFISNNHGVNHSKAKFCELDILKILVLRYRNGIIAKEIGEQMGVSESAIINICAGRRYKKEYAKIMAMPKYGIWKAI